MNDFITYWFPQLKSKEYNLIKFLSKTDINARFPLDITPQPDTIIRIFMLFKPINRVYFDRKYKTEPCKLPHVISDLELLRQNDHFVVVEWGGTHVQ